MSTIEGWRDTVVPSLAGAMAPDPGAQPRAFSVDFGIVPGSIPHVSYSDLADGDVPLAAIAGRRGFVGLPPSRLAGAVPVPAWRPLPAPMIPAIAAPTLLPGRGHPPARTRVP